jgi:hypothetical protein
LQTKRQRVRRGQCIDALEAKASELLRQARDLVVSCCTKACADKIDCSGRFPTVARSDPRSARMRELHAEYRRLKDLARRATMDERRKSLQLRIDAVVNQAETLSEGRCDWTPRSPASV